MMRVTEEQVQLAYRKLKSLVYFDKTDLRLRARLAAFECSKDFDKKLAAVHEVANATQPSSSPKFKKWLRDVKYRLVPKKLKVGPLDLPDPQIQKGRFITNVTTGPIIEVEKVNFFFDGPIELHLIAVIWIMLEGRHLDEMLYDNCFGSRLSRHLSNEEDDSLALFTKYHEQYSRWRDTGIRKAKELLVDERRNVAILGLDVQEYYYRINIDFDEINSFIGAIDNKPSKNKMSSLLSCVQAIGESYRECISPAFNRTHPNIADSVAGLPIGLCSSLILANWYLQTFDSAIMGEVRPAYYGRYVDDILLVVPLPSDPSDNNDNPVTAFIESLLVNTNILRESEEGAYEICVRPGLLLQQSKCILQYFDARHSIAGLEKFQKKLEQNGSAFLLLPADEADSSMEDVAYELLYEGSSNKFRNIKSVSENRYELAKHLAKQTILYLMTDDPPDRKVSLDLRKFFKGRNAIEFFDLWERVLTLLGIANDRVTFNAFSKQLNTEISRVRTDEAIVTKQLIADLKKHLELSIAMADAVSAEDFGLSELVDNVHSESLRSANLLRHHFVRRPLLNFTTYKGPLSNRETNLSVKLDQRKTKYSPRFVNFDECMLLVYSGVLPQSTKTVFGQASRIFEAINRHPVAGVSWTAPMTIEG